MPRSTSTSKIKNNFWIVHKKWTLWCYVKVTQNSLSLCLKLNTSLCYLRMLTYVTLERERALEPSLKSATIKHLFERWICFCPSFSFNVKNSLLRNYCCFSLRVSVKDQTLCWVHFTSELVMLWIVSTFCCCCYFERCPCSVDIPCRKRNSCRLNFMKDEATLPAEVPGIVLCYRLRLFV